MYIFFLGGGGFCQWQIICLGRPEIPNSADLCQWVCYVHPLGNMLPVVYTELF